MSRLLLPLLLLLAPVARAAGAEEVPPSESPSTVTPVSEEAPQEVPEEEAAAEANPHEFSWHWG